MRITILIILALFTVPLLAFAQDTPQTEYATNALRITHGLFGSKVVQGTNDTKISNLNWFASDIEFLSERDDQVSLTFESYRTKKNLSGAMYLLSIAAMVGFATTYDTYDSESSEALFWGSFGLAIGGGLVNISANESLSQSIWMYNSTLDTRGP